MKRVIEDFSCEQCGHHQSGNGYTNHCSKCLWSKHVDVEPGDRNADCGGLMKPTNLETLGTGFRITHECTACGYRKPNKCAPDDNVEAIMSEQRPPI